MTAANMIMHRVTKQTNISNWFHEHDTEWFSVLPWPFQSPDLNPVEHLRDVVESEILNMNPNFKNLQNL